MRRFFAILAVIAGLILLVGFVSSIVAPGPGDFAWALASIGVTVVVYATAGFWVALSRAGVSKIAERLEMPDWVKAQAEKNERKVLAYHLVGLPMLGVIVASDLLPTSGPFSLGLQALNLAFQLGAFLGMSVVIVAQERLSSDVRAWADSVRPVGAL
jgi:hypothetical protein